MNQETTEPQSTGNPILGCLVGLVFDVVLIGVIYGIMRLIQFLS